MNHSFRVLVLTVGVSLAFIMPVSADTKPDRSTLPDAAQSTVWAPPTVETWTTSNGMTVWFLRQDQAPLVSLSLVMEQGTATDPKGKAGLTNLMVDMLDEGAGTRDGYALRTIHFKSAIQAPSWVTLHLVNG